MPDRAVHNVQIDAGLWDWFKVHYEVKNPASRMRAVLEDFAREQSRTGDTQLDLRIAAPGNQPETTIDGTAVDHGAVMPARRDTSCDQCGIYVRRGTLVHYFKTTPGGPTHCRCAVHKEEEDLG